MTRVTLRKVPGALALGLLASLAAHASLYGGDHAMGGGFHGLLVEAALAGALGLLVVFGALAWTESGCSADGSVLAARLRDRLPSFLGVWLAAGGSYAVAEAVEPHHAITSPLALIIALAAAAWLIRTLARGLAGVLARAVFAVRRPAFVPRAPAWNRRERPRPLARRALLTRQRFARPPPVVVPARA